MANYGITNKNQIIDKDSIDKGCNKILEALEDFKISAKRVKEAGELSSSKALEINGKSFTNSIMEIADSLEDDVKKYTNCINQIKAETNKVYNSQLSEYNNYIAEKEKEKNSNKN